MNNRIRPTSAKVISALFNILRSASLCGEAFLDLFAGTGAVASEALRQGAPSVTCVDSDAGHVETISRALADIGLPSGRASCLKSDVRRLIPRLARNVPAREFGVVFADPPYCSGWGEILPQLMENNWNIVKPGGVFVFERSSRETPADFFTQRDDRIYGETVLSFYWKRASD